MKQRILSLVLALCFLVGLCVPAWATTTVTASGQEVTATLKATVKSSNINVTVPTVLPFTLDLSKDITDSTYGQISAGETFTVTNNSSVVPVYLAVKDVIPDSSSGITLTCYKQHLSGHKIIVDIFRAGNEPNYSSSLAQGAYARRVKMNDDHFLYKSDVAGSGLYSYGWSSDSDYYDLYDRYYLTLSSVPIAVNTSENYHLSVATGSDFSLSAGESFSITVTFIALSEYVEPTFVKRIGSSVS